FPTRRPSMSAVDPDADRDSLDRLAEEIMERCRRGERPSPSEYAARYPERAEEIRELFPALVLMERLKPAGEAPGEAAGPRMGAGTPPIRLGDFLIIREIGRGGMGIVYEAEQESLGRRVALKVLPGSHTDPIQRRRFELEARSAARLHHTNIVPVFGVGESDGVHYYAMQFIHGQSLDAVIDELRRLRGGGHISAIASSDQATLAGTVPRALLASPPP